MSDDTCCQLELIGFRPARGAAGAVYTAVQTWTGATPDTDMLREALDEFLDA